MLIYLIQANIALVLFAILYKYTLSSDTLFTLRRASLISFIIFSFTIQFIPAIADINISSNQQSINLTIIESTTTPVAAHANAHYQLATLDLLTIVWLFGILLLSIRFTSGLITILKLKSKASPTSINGTEILLTHRELPPFSFYRWIFLSPSQLEKSDILDVITHEKSHIESYHIIDVIISELLIIILWFNPAAWFIRYAIRENLEFSADRNVIDCGHNRKEYQYHLLKLSYSPSVTNIVNYFNVSQLKNRIIMMNKEKAPKKAALKYLLLIPALMVLSLTNNAQTKDTKAINVTKIKTEEKKSSPEIKVNGYTIKAKEGINIKDGKVLIILDGKEISGNEFEKVSPESIASVTVLKDAEAIKLYGKKGENGVVLMESKNKISPNDIKVVGFGNNKLKEEIKVRGSNLDNVLIILNGKETTKGEFEKLSPENIASVSVLKDAEAIKVYGKKGENGVIVIESKNKISLNDIKVVGFGNNKLKEEIKVRGSDLDNVLIILDGKEATKGEFEKIRPDQVESISVLKDKSATDVYGDKGKNGVVIITLKK